LYLFSTVKKMKKTLEALYIERSTLSGRMSSLKTFYDSWWATKCSSHQTNSLADYYDLFIARFICYNALYNAIVDEKGGPQGDFQRATKEMASYSGNQRLESLMEQNRLEAIKEGLIDILDSKAFNFTLKKKTRDPDPASDQKILANLNNPATMLLGILELMYQVRCNLFHGSKGYEEVQKAILKPLSEFLLLFVPVLFDSFSKGVERKLTLLEREIKLQEK